MHSNGQVGMPVPAADAIVVDGLSKTYQVPEREGGFGAAVRGSRWVSFSGLMRTVDIVCPPKTEEGEAANYANSHEFTFGLMRETCN